MGKARTFDAKKEKWLVVSGKLAEVVEAENFEEAFKQAIIKSLRTYGEHETGDFGEIVSAIPLYAIRRLHKEEYIGLTEFLLKKLAKKNILYHRIEKV